MTVRPYPEWEDYQAGMYVRPVTDASTYSRMTELVVQLMRDADELQTAMSAVANQWVHAAEANMSRAWLGQAACCYLHGIPEWITRAAWNASLTEEERAQANAIADGVIEEWEGSRAQTLFR